MKIAAFLLLLGGTSRIGGPEGSADRGAAPWTIEVALSLAQKDGKWVFGIDGRTNLPARTVLRARVYVINEVDDPFQGPGEDDDEPLVRSDDERQPSFHRFHAGAGKIRESVYTFARKPYSIRYRAKVHYYPEDQIDAVTLKVGDTEFFRQADLRAGTDVSYQAELKERVEELAKDFIALEKRGGELDGWAERAAKEPPGWAVWKKDALAWSAALNERNLDRFNVWAVWPEYQGRMRVRGLAEYFERTVEAVDARDEAAAVRERLRYFQELLDEAYTVIGIDAPLDATLAGPAFAAYQQSVDPLRGRIQEADLRRKVRAEGIAALFDLLKMIRTRHRAYLYVNRLGDRFTRVFELVHQGADPEQLDAALRAHDEALREFRAYAGLP